MELEKLNPGQKAKIEGRDEIIIAVATDSILCASGAVYCTFQPPQSFEPGEIAEAGSYTITDDAQVMLDAVRGDESVRMIEIAA